VVGSVQKTLGTNLAFRSDQANVKSLNNVGIDSAVGSLAICNIALSSSPVNAASILNASATTLNFGNVSISGSSNQNIALKNTGTSNVTISKVSVAGAGFTAGGGAAGLTLSPNQSTTVLATFAPASTGTLTGSVTVSSNAKNSSVLITLSGIGVAAATRTVALSQTPGGANQIGYNVYVGSTSGGPYSRLNTTSVAETTFIDSSAQSGQTYYFVVTSINLANQESSHSTEAKAVVP
jgi:hypothetical protein